MTSLFPLPSPSLPPFATLLIKGPFHASAPIHLCLTHIASRPDTKALVLTPSQEKWRQALCDFNDDWLNECGGFGAVSQNLSKVDIFYPPTTSHVALLLSMFRVSEASDEAAFNARTTLDTPPSLIVLHELSTYFLDENVSSSQTVAGYVSLIAHVLSASYALAAQTPGCLPSVVLMDSRLDELKLPVLKHPGPNFLAGNTDEQSTDGRRKESIAYIIQQYFQWVGTIEKRQPPPSETEGTSQAASSYAQHAVFTHTMRLRNMCDSGEQSDIVWEWNEREGLPRGFSERPGTIFTWP